jgi:RNA polymerase sigma factor (sigma-70 family)
MTAGAAAPPDRATCTDAALIQLSLAESERFATVFDRHAAEIYRYLAGRLGPDVADDVTAETFLTAFRKRAQYDLDRADARPWLYGIATRLISDHRRTERRRARALARAPVAGPPEPFEDATAERLTAERMIRALAGALGTLSAADRDLLLLVAWTDLTYGDIGQALGIATGTVASRLHRIRKKILRNSPASSRAPT